MLASIDILENKKTISKTDRQTIQQGYNQLQRLLTDKLPFIQNLITEDIEDHTTKASAQFKTEMNQLLEKLTNPQQQTYLQSIMQSHNNTPLQNKKEDQPLHD